MKKLNIGSKVIHAGASQSLQGQPFSDSPVFASTFHLQGSTDNADYQYGRFGNPTWTSLESYLSELEGGETVLFPSGMGAISAVLSALLKSGDTLLLPADGYYATRAFATEFLIPNGIKTHFVKTTELLAFDFSSVDFVMIETPSNPLLDVVDISMLANKVHSANGILAIDNTAMTFHGQNPLALGADISICADTKALNGHSDVLLGHVSTHHHEIFARVKLWRTLSGSIPGPMEAWLVQRGLTTLDMRLQRMSSNALSIAKMLNEHERVQKVRYPGLVTDPSYHVSTEQMRHFGFLVSFDLGCMQSACNFLQATSLIAEATSFGGVHTMAERRARWGTDDVSEGLVRLSVGCEAIDDLLKDINQALDRL